MAKLNLDSVDRYMESSLKILRENLSRFFRDISKITIKDIHDKLHEINSYPNLDHLENIKHHELVILDEDKIDINEAKKMIIDGEFFWEHAAAGEATRLGMGPKYFLEIHNIDIREIHKMILDEAKDGMSEEDYRDYEKKNSLESFKSSLKCDTKDLLPYSFGERHMLQMIYDLKKLAKHEGVDAKELIRKQQCLIVVNESSADRVIKDFMRYDFFTLEPKNVFFMVQKSFHGITIEDGELKYNKNSDKRLHNHGQMFMQKLHDDSIFWIKEGQRIYLKSEDYLAMLKKHKLMLSYNIEDIGYLTNAIDWPSLALALELEKDGYEMIMEIVRQNPLKPQKGGAAFRDKKLGRICMIESNQLKGIKNEDIEHLNKNFNIYPNPSRIFERLKREGLPMNIDVKKGSDGDYHIYFAPVQGDINFLAKTAFVMRKNPKPIRNLKSPATFPPTIDYMYEQDRQEGFKELAEEIIS